MSSDEPQWFYDQFKHDPFTIPPMKLPTPLYGKIVCITGILSVTRGEFAILLEDAGAVVTSSLSGSTDILIVGENPGAKINKARAQGTAIWDEAKARAVMAGTAQGVHTAKLYGTSDDCVEITGESAEELNVIDEPAYIRFTNGTYAKIEYAAEGIWRIEVLAAGRGKLRKLFGMPDNRDIKEDGPNPQAHNDTDAPVYSDVLVISSEEPIEMETWSRKPLNEVPAALAYAKRIIMALDDRGGFDHWWHDIAEDDKYEILTEISKITEEAVGKAMDKWMSS